MKKFPKPGILFIFLRKPNQILGAFFMLSDLLGSKSAERILLFLLVNEFGSASDMQKAYAIALSPLQNILRKFEQIGLLQYEAEKNTKLYRFNCAYPLLSELKALLKRAFIHLPANEKRALFSTKTGWKTSLKDHYVHQKRVALCLEAFWQRAQQIKKVSIQTQSGGQAFGEVHVAQENERSLLFAEQGHWLHLTKKPIDFTNHVRWSIDRAAGLIALEHLRYGADRPVFLFHLAPTGPNTLQSIDSHLCLEDCYFGRIEFTKQHIRLLWRILGPRKNEIQHHVYSS